MRSHRQCNLEKKENCLKKGILTTFMQDKQKEAEDIMITLFSREEIDRNFSTTIIFAQKGIAKGPHRCGEVLLEKIICIE